MLTRTVLFALLTVPPVHSFNGYVVCQLLDIADKLYVEFGVSKKTRHSTRREALQSAIGGGAWIAFTAISFADGTSALKVSPSPPVHLFEPFYELKIAIDALVEIDSLDPKKWPRMLRRLDMFFAATSGDGNAKSERDVYIEVGKCYIVRMDDSDARMKDLYETMQNLLEMRNSLERILTIAKRNAREEACLLAISDIHNCALGAQRSLSKWFDNVPEKDVTVIAQLLRDVNDADKDRDGKLSASELQRLPIEERGIWERRVATFGRAGKVERSLGFKIGHKDFI